MTPRIVTKPRYKRYCSRSHRIKQERNRKTIALCFQGYSVVVGGLLGICVATIIINYVRPGHPIVYVVRNAIGSILRVLGIV